ncbi:hypothetical protein ACWGIU_25470 [Streptomyces sp. NPDC054840]
MPDLPPFHNAIIDAIMDHASRATLPFQRANRAEQHATAFWFNELVEETDEGSVVRQYLVTAGERTSGPRPDAAQSRTPSPARPAPARLAEVVQQVGQVRHSLE